MQPDSTSVPSTQPNQQPGQPAALPVAPVPAPVPQPGAASPQTVPVQPQPPQQPAAKTASNPNSTQNSLEIAEIRDGIVIMKDGSFRSVVMAKSINFDLMSGSEQEAVEYAYQGFLNSLYFDIQIFIRSRKIDMRPYLEKLSRVRTDMSNMLLGMLMEDYIYFIDDLVQQTNIMSKEFYVVIPYTTEVNAGKALEASKGLLSGLFGNKTQAVVTINEADLEKAKTELTNRVQSVMSGLMQMGVQAMPLDTNELIALYYNTYNPDTATRQVLKSTDMFAVPVITKGKGQAPQSDMGGVM